MASRNRDLIWEDLLDAHARALFFGDVASENQTLERRLALTVGALSGSAFVSIVAKVHVPWLAEGLSLISAIAAVALTSQKYGKSADVAAALCRKWMAIQDQLEVLFRQMPDLVDDEVLKRRTEIAEIHRVDDETAARILKKDPALVSRCQAKVLELRRLGNANSG